MKLTSAPTARWRYGLLRAALPLAIVGAFVAGAISLFVVLRPFDRVQLGGSSWTITELDGSSPGRDISLVFGTTSWVEAPCFRLEFEWDADTDDVSIEFYPRAVRQDGCSPDASAQNDRLETALTRVEEIRAPLLGERRVEFYGSGQRLLVAMPRGTVGQ